MLELLSSALLVTIGDGAVVDFLDVGEPVDNEGAEKHRVAYLVPFDRQTDQIG